MADASIIIDTKLENRQFVAGSKEMLQAINSFKRSTIQAGKDMRTAVSGYGTAMRASIKANREATATMEELRQKAQQLEKAQEQLGKAKVATDEYKSVINDLQKAEDKYNSLIDKKRYFEKAADDKMVKSIDKQLDDLGQKMDYLGQKKESMEQRGTAFISGKDSNTYRENERRLDEISEHYREIEQIKNEALKPPYLESWQNMVRLSGMLSEGFGRIQNVAAGALHAIAHPIQALDRGLGFIIQKAGQTAVALAKMAGKAALSFLRKLADGAKNAAIQLAKLAGNAIKGGLAKLGGLAANAAKGILGLGKSAKKSNGGLGASFKTILKYAFGIRSLFFLFRRLRSAVTEGLGEIAKHNPELKGAIDSLKKSFNALKGSLATAFAPIVTAVAPAITTLINMLTNAINTIGAFIAALTGKTTYQKSIGAIGSEASSSAKGVKELNRQLASFDQLDILSDNKSGSGSSGASGSGFAYETEEIDSGISDFAKQLKQMWEDADFEGIGQTIADKINGFIGAAKEKISWENLGDKITEIVDGVTGTFNGLVSGIDWENLGNTFGEGANTLIRTINQIFDKTNFVNLGKGLADALNGLGDTVDWEELGKFFKNKIQAIIDIIKGLVNDFDWGEAGLNFATTVKGFYDKQTWDDLTDTIGTAINGVLDALSNAVKGFEWGQVGKDFGAEVNRLKNKVDWPKLGDTLAGLLGAAISAIKNFAVEIEWEDGATKITDAINEFFKDEQIWEDVGTTFNELLNGALDFSIQFLNNFNEDQFAKDVKAALKNVKWGQIADKVWELFKAALTSAGNFIDALLGGEWKQNYDISVSDAINEKLAIKNGKVDDVGEQSLGGTLSKLAKSILAAIKSAFDAIPWNEWGTKIHDFFTKDVDWKGIWEGVYDVFKSAFSGLGEFVDGLLGNDSSETGEKKTSNIIPTVIGAIGGSKVIKALGSILGGGAAAAGGSLGSALGLFAGTAGIIGAAGTVAGNNAYDWLRENYGDVLDDLVEYNKNKHDLTGKQYNNLSGNPAVDAFLAIFGGKDVLDKVEKANNPIYNRDNDRRQKATGTEGGNQITDDELIGVAKQLKDMGYSEDEIIKNLKMTDRQADAVRKALEDNTEATDDWKAAWKKAWDEGTPGNVGEELKFSSDWDEFVGHPFEVDVGVNFGPAEGAGGKAGSVGAGRYKNKGLLQYLKDIFSPGTTTEARVELLKKGWTTLTKFVGTDSPLSALVGLGKHAWTTITSFLGIDKPLNATIDLVKKTVGQTVGSFFGLVNGAFTATAELSKKNSTDSVGNLFGTFISVLASLGKKTSTDSSGNLFGTFIGVLASLGKKTSTDSSGSLFGTAISVLASLSKKTSTDSSGNLFGTLIGVAASLGKKTSSDSSGNLFGTSITVDATLEKANPYQTIASLFGAVGNAVTMTVDAVGSWASTVGGILPYLGIGNLNTDVGMNPVKNWIGSVLGVVDLDNVNSDVKMSLTKGWGTKTPQAELGLDNLVATIKAQLAVDQKANQVTATFSGGGTGKGVWTLATKALGGILQHGIWRNIPQYARGTANAGSLFIAGEAGPELVGHVGGRTEVLNKSQLASTMYSAVSAGMVTALRGLQFRVPAMATGGVLPYEVSAQIAKSTADLQGTLDANNEDLIQTIISVAGQIVAAIQRQPSGGGSVGGTTAQQLINEINRRTQMFSASPLKGV